MKQHDLIIALTDDDLDDQEIFAEALEQVHPEVKLLTFGNGEQLMQYLHTNNGPIPDLLFLDLNMPVKDGKTCLAEIRSSEAFQQLPIAIYSTSSSRNHIVETRQMGANWYISKPSSFTGVKKIVNKMVSMVREESPTVREELYLITL